MPVYNKEELELVTLDLENLSLPDTLTSLMLGDTLVIRGYESTRGKDILVKLDDRKHKMTYISFDLDPFNPSERYWLIHNVSLNALSLHDVYRYDEYTFSLAYKYKPRDLVQIEGRPDIVHIINNVHVSPDKEVYYTLEGLDGYYQENELTPYK